MMIGWILVFGVCLVVAGIGTMALYMRVPSDSIWDLVLSVAGYVLLMSGGVSLLVVVVCLVFLGMPLDATLMDKVGAAEGCGS